MAGGATDLRMRSSAFTNPYPARLENINYRGWNATRLSNGLVSLIIVPDIGGRAIQLLLGDRELFFVARSIRSQRSRPEYGQRCRNSPDGPG
jgi:hypothetical protein